VRSKDLARTWPGITAICEPRNDTRALIDKRQRWLVVDPFERRSRIAGGLFLHSRNFVAPILGFRLDHADRLLINEKHIVGRANVGLVLANGDALARVKIDVLFVLNDPARLGQILVDLITSDLFGVLVLVGDIHISFARLPRLRTHNQ
jgi:hypothetical protein